MKKWLVYCCIVSLLFAFAPLAVQAGQASSAEMVQRMGSGINMGNTLEPPFEGDWATEAKEYYFDDYKAAGFKNVRIPIRWDNHTEKTDPYKIDSAFLDRVEQIVDWSLSRGLVTIINAHHDTWVMEDYDHNIERLEAIWRQISERFKSKSENLLFEVLNEPNGNITDGQINDMNQRILTLIRGTNPTRQVIIGAGFWNSWRSLVYNLRLPEDPNLIATFHYYDPYAFTHELTGTWGTEADKAEVRKSFDAVKAWSEKNHIPVYLGEYGAKVETDASTRLVWYDFISDIAQKYGFASSVWDDEGWFKLYDRKTRTFDQDTLKKIKETGPFTWPSPTPTPVPTPTPTPPVYSTGEKMVDDFEGTLQWGGYQGSGATVTAVLAAGKTGKGMTVDFSNSSSGYWGVVRDINADWSSWLKLSFDIKADKVNNFNVVLTEKAADQTSDGENWSYTVRPSTAWTTVVIPFADFGKRIDYQPPGEDGNQYFNLEKIKNIQFLQSNTGSGTFTVDNIELIGLPSGGTPTPTPSVTPTPTATPTATPTPTPTVTPTPTPTSEAGKLVVQYKAGNTNATDNQMQPHFNIKNNGTTAVKLSDLKLRYYFTKEGSLALSSWVDWAVIGSANINRTFTDSYMEVSFTDAAGSIAPNGQTGDIQIRISNSEWSNLNEANDYSYDPTLTSYTDYKKVTLFKSGQLVWGIEP